MNNQADGTSDNRFRFQFARQHKQHDYICILAVPQPFPGALCWRDDPHIWDLDKAQAS